MTPLKNLLLEKEGSCEHAKCGCEEHLGRLPFRSAGIPFLKSSAEDPPAIPKCIEGTMVLQVVLETGVGSLALPSPHGFFFSFWLCKMSPDGDFAYLRDVHCLQRLVCPSGSQS